MKINSIKYFVKEAGKNVFSNGWMSVASVFTVVASLLVFGIFMVLVLNLNFIVGQVESDYEINLVIEESLDTQAIEALGQQLKNTENVAEVIFASKHDRLNDLKDQFGDQSSLLDSYQNEENPLRHWFKIRCVDLSKSAATVDVVKAYPGVAKVISNSSTIDKLTSASGHISTMSAWMMLALAIISVFIISNTIKLTVFTRRKEINIMKYVGATDWFIRWPFIIEGMFLGLIGAVVSSLVISFGYQGFSAFFNALGIAFIRFMPLSDVIGFLIGAFILLGVVLGAVGSLISVRKHLQV